MPTPIAHALAGYAVYQGLRGNRANDWRVGVLAVGLAIAPDLDFLPGMLQGQPALYHQEFTHSIGFGLLVCLGLALILRVRGRLQPPIMLMSLAAYGSHLLLDTFSRDGRLPYGVPLLWPLHDQRFISPIPIFMGVHHPGLAADSTLQWMAGVINWHNVGEIALEIGIMGLVIVLIWWWRRRKTTAVL